MKALATLFIGILAITPAFGEKVLSTFSPNDISVPLKYGAHYETQHTITTFDSHLWSGYATFELGIKFPSGESASIIVRDGNDRQWEITNRSPIKTKLFKRLKTPVFIDAKGVSYSGNILDLKQMHFEYVTLPRFTKGLEGTFGFHRKSIFKFDPFVLGTAKVKATAQFFENYEAGTECARITLTDTNGESFELTDKNTSEEKEMSLPLTVWEDPSCHSSSLKSPEDPGKDYLLSVELVNFN